MTPRPARPWLGPALVGLGVLACHAAGWDRYGVFRDELYFISCGERLSWGYVDQPPLVALVARFAHRTFGLWVPGLRLLPWIASAATAWAAGLLALELGAGALAATLAAVAVGTSPVLMALGHYLTMNAFEPALFTLLAWVLVRLAGGGSPRLWLAAGAIAGAGMENKYSMAPYAATLLAGMTLTPEGRSALRSRWAVAGALLAAALAVPSLAWQAAHGFPFLELIRNGQLHKNAPVSPGSFLSAQIMEMNPLNALLWIPGLLVLLRSGRPTAGGPAARHPAAGRFLAVGFLLLLGFDLAAKAKPYYLAPAFPPLLAAGAVAWQQILERLGKRFRSSAGAGPRITHGSLAALALALLASWSAIAPLAIPVRSVEGFLATRGAVGFEPARLERGRAGRLPQIYADQHGWPELARAVHQAWTMLPEEERGRAMVFAQNYGQASAVELYGRALGLPPVASGHNQWFLWGPPPGRDVAIVIGGEREDCGGAFRSRELLLRMPDDPLVMPYESGRHIWACREPLLPVAELWPRVRKYI